MCETKVCAHCGKELPVSLFCKSKKSKDGLQSWCTPCTAEYARTRRAKVATERKEMRARLFESAKEAVEAAPLGAKTIVTKDGRTLHRVEENCKPIGAFSPRELLEELKRRGYVWDSMWVKTRVDYNNI